VTYARRQLLTLPDVSHREVVVVGSGRSLLGSGLGETIDSFKQVVRFNLFVTKGFEPDVGSCVPTPPAHSINPPVTMPSCRLWSVGQVPTASVKSPPHANTMQCS
jgi:hypothetical protein